MKNHLFSLLAILSTLNGFAQIEFEKAYFINNSNQKTECFIKNVDWLDNPVDFQYKLSEDSNSQTAGIKNVKEFGVYNKSKYIRTVVEIDRSINTIGNLSRTSSPTFNQEELFLKVLVEGKANLYEYINGDLTKYFYNVENAPIKQLVYKEYLNNIENKEVSNTIEYKEVISKNNYYRQQLWNNLKCDNFTENRLKNIDYRRHDLEVFFIEYSNCNNEKVLVINQEATKNLLKLTIRPRLNSSSLSVKNSDADYKNTDFGNKTGFGLGLEAEYVLPFNKNKWSFLIEPTYQSYKSEKSSNLEAPREGTLTRKIDYKSLEIPFGIRYYFFLTQNSKIFVNTSIVPNFSLNSSIKYYLNNLAMAPVEIDSRINLAIGIGYKYNDKFSLEMRYQTKRELFGKSFIWSSEYKALSVIFGYSIF